MNATPVKASLACLVGAVASIGLSARAASRAQRVGAPPGQTLAIRALPVQGFDTTRIYMLVGAGGNIAVQIGEQGVLLVDTGAAAASDAVMAAIRTLTDKPIRYIINTHAHPDHVGGNESIVAASGGQRTDVGGGNGGPRQPRRRDPGRSSEHR